MQLFGFDTGSIGSLISMPLFKSEFGDFNDVRVPHLTLVPLGLEQP